MRARTSILLVVVSALAAALGAAACTSILGYDDLTVRTVAADSGATDVVTDGGPVDTGPEADLRSVNPPPRPKGDPKPSGKGKDLWFVVKRFYLSTQSLGVEIPPDGGATKTSKDAWKVLGYDIDHICTGELESKENTGTCLRPSGANQNSLLDGEGCRDNNFGSQLIPLVVSFDNTFEDDSNRGVLGGANTLVIKLEDVDDGENDPYVPAKIYKAANILGYPASKPAWDGTDVRQVDSRSVLDNDVNKPKTSFPKGYLTKNTWVSGEPGKFSIIIPVNTVNSELALVGGTMTLVLSPDHTAASAGVMAGAIAYTDLEPAIRPIAEAASLCSDSPFYATLIKNVRQFMDVVSDSPTLQSVSVECNGLSIGMAFEFANIQPVKQAVYVPPFTSSCSKPDGG